ncbi:MAG: hypothetical protein RL139_1211 [Gemmatimonadota bacterium]|jgi:Carboxypeptidase regulatory-like domain
MYGMRLRLRRGCLVIATPLLAACGAEHGMDQSTNPAATWPAGPYRPAETNLRGTVIDQATSAPVGGARVEAGTVVWVTDSTGAYTLQRLTMLAVEVVTSRAGYDTARTLLPLEGGDKVFTVRLRASTTPP